MTRKRFIKLTMGKARISRRLAEAMATLEPGQSYQELWEQQRLFRAGRSLSAAVKAMGVALLPIAAGFQAFVRAMREAAERVDAYRTEEILKEARGDGS